MPEPIWYFAVGDEERGPVTEAQIRTLIGTGNLKRDDLVWREGLDDWMPAGEIPGLFGKEPGATKGEPPVVRNSQEPGPKKDSATVPPAVPASPPLRRLHIRLAAPVDVFRHWAFVAQPLVLGGFLVMLLSKGCDALAERDVARTNARPQLAENRFKDEWDREKAPLEKQRQELVEREKNGATAQPALGTVEKQLRELDERKQREREQLLQGPWQTLKAAARDAQARSDAWGFWREGFFWLGTAVFSLGLLPVVFSGTAPERWAGLALLAIVVFRLFFRLGG
jgi:hypothetical protein